VAVPVIGFSFGFGALTNASNLDRRFRHRSGKSPG
jgi:hypothetical protein